MFVTLVVAGKELRRRVRDRSAVVTAFVAPAVLAVILSAALGGDLSFHMTVAYADLDGGPVARELEAALTAEPARRVMTVRRFETEAEVREQVDRGFAAAIVVPPGFSDAVVGGEPARLRVIESTESPVAAGVATAFAEGFAQRVEAGRLAAVTAINAGAEPGEAFGGAGEVAAGPPSIELRDEFTQGPAEGAATYYGPAMAVFFLFFAVAIGARTLISERDEGTLARLLAAPVRPAALLGGVGLSTFILGLASMAAMVAFSSVLLGATWGDPAAVTALVVATVVAGIGITAVISAGARTAQQADTAVSAASVVMGLLGGSFISFAGSGGALGTLRWLTPHGWALDGFGAVGFERGGLGDVTLNVAVLLAMGAVGILAALRLSRRLVRPA